MPSVSFDSFAKVSAHIAGTAWFFVLSVALTVVWLLSGFWTGFNETWNFWANTSTTVTTWLLVILVQNSQNRDTQALQTKIDALVKASKATNAVLGMEDMPEKEQQQLKETLR